MSKSTKRINTLEGDEDMKSGLVSGNYATNREDVDKN